MIDPTVTDLAVTDLAVTDLAAMWVQRSPHPRRQPCVEQPRRLSLIDERCVMRGGGIEVERLVRPVRGPAQWVGCSWLAAFTT